MPLRPQLPLFLLPPPLLRGLLQEEELQARSEEVLLEALLRWHDHDPLSRREHTIELASSVRWPFIPAAAVARLEMTRPELFGDVRLLRLSREAYRHQALDASSDGQAVLAAMPRSPRPCCAALAPLELCLARLTHAACPCFPTAATASTTWERTWSCTK